MTEQSDAMERITGLARLMMEQETAVANATDDLASKKAALLDTKRVVLPELMREYDLAMFGLKTGELVTVKDDVSAAIPATRREEAVEWLVARNYDGIVRTTLTLEYSRGEHGTAAQDAIKISQLLGRPALLESTVHPQTLRAFVREVMERGEVIPFDLFGVHPYTEAKIKRS